MLGVGKLKTGLNPLGLGKNPLILGCARGYLHGANAGSTGKTMPVDLKFCTGAVVVFSLLCMVGLCLWFFIDYITWAGSQSNSRDSVAARCCRGIGRERSGSRRGHLGSLGHPLHYMILDLPRKKFLMFFKYKY